MEQIVENLFNEFCIKQGWNDSTQIQILLNYIEEQNIPISTFINHLNRIANEKNTGIEQ